MIPGVAGEMGTYFKRGAAAPPYSPPVSMTTTTAHQRSEDDPAVNSIQEQVRSAVLDLAAALAAVIDALPQPVRRAADLERALKLQTPLAWRIFRLSQAPDAAAAVEYLPTVKQLERVAARAAGEVPPDVAARASAAVQRFAELVKTVGGGQRGFESVASGLSPAGVRRVELDHRRLAFRGNTHLWGLQARCLVACGIERPGAAPGTRDGILVRGLLDLQALRPDLVPKVLARSRVVDGDPAESAPLAPSAEPRMWKSELRLLDQFSGPRLPELSTIQTDDDWQQTEIRLPGVGKADAVSFYLHQRFRGAKEDNLPGLGMLVDTPAEWLHLEFIVPHGWTSPATARAAAFASRHDVRRAYEIRPEDRVPLHERVQHFGPRETVPAAAELPGWPDIVRHVLVEEGWWGERFDIYRCVVPFPMMHAWTGFFVDRAPSA